MILNKSSMMLANIISRTLLYMFLKIEKVKQLEMKNEK